MDGIIPVIKPPGITSHDAVGIMRRILSERRIGHSGTLDPMAIGVLPIFVGKATRLVEYTNDYKKVYIAEGQFGFATDTEDITGNPLPTPPFNVNNDGYHNIVSETPTNSAPTFAELKSTCELFTGAIQQTPSSYSAIKIKGRRAYEWAREGIAVELPSREITIYTISLLAYRYPWFTIRVECSGGTYIRALLRDILNALHIPCTMTALLRSKVCEYTIANAVTFEEVEAEGMHLLHPMEEAVTHLNRIEVNEEQVQSLIQGKRLSIETFRNGTALKESGIYSLFSAGKFFGIVEQTETYIKGKKMIYEQS